MTDTLAASTPARRLRDAIEPFHGFCYFVDDTKARYLELGLHPWAAYFGQRAAAMGAVGAEVVTATFYGFSPRLVEQSIPSVWSSISPEEAWNDRVAKVRIVLQRLGDSAPPPQDLERGVEIGERMLAAFATGGRPLGTAHAAMHRPADLLVRLWVIATAMREYRGDGHVAALVTNGVGPIESLATSAGFSNLSLRFHQRARGWGGDEWQAGVDRATEHGWVDASGALTADGVRLRHEVEELTDAAAADLVMAVSSDDLAFFLGLNGQLSSAVRELGAFPH